MKNDYIVSRVYRSFVIVSILTALSATVGILIDNIIVGQLLGSDALGAMGIVGPISTIFSAFGNICAGGGTAKAAQALGRGERNQLNRIFTITILFALTAGLLLTVAGLILTPQIATLLGARGDLVALTEQYLYGYLPSAIPTIMMTCLMGFFRVDGSPRLPLVCIGVMTVTNITLDFVMVLVFDLGMLGMSLATTFGYGLAVIVAILLHFRKKTSTLKIVKPQQLFKGLASIAMTGAPTAISRICDTFKVSILNNMLVTIVGISAVSAFSVRTQVNNILGAVLVGTGQALLPVAGMFFGQEDRTALKDTLKSSLKIGLGLCIGIGIILLIIPEAFISLLGVTDSDTVNMAKEAIRLFAIGMPVSLINMLLMNFYQCTSRTIFATVICVLQNLAYTLLFAVILINPLQSTGVWIAFLLSEIMTLITIIIRTICKNRKFSLSLNSFMMLDKDFGGNPEDRFEISIGNSIDEVVNISTEIYKFGKDRNIDERTMGVLSLFIEELAGNVVQHAFKEGEKRWLDIMVLNKEDSVVISLRDNAEKFDPEAYINANGRVVAENTEHMGLNLVYALSDRFEYRYNMGINIVIAVLNKNKSNS